MKIIITAEPRHQTKRHNCKRMRQSGQLPANLYGEAKAPESIILPLKTVENIRRHTTLRGNIITIMLNNTQQRALIKNTQEHPLTQDLLHIDLQRVHASHTIEADVNIAFQGTDEAPAKKEGGEIVHCITQLSITCKPVDLPKNLPVDTSQMHINDTLHLDDITLPKGVCLKTPTSETHNPPIVAFRPPKKQKDIDTTLRPLKDDNETTTEESHNEQPD